MQVPLPAFSMNVRLDQRGFGCHVLPMVLRTPAELRVSASELRAMASEGGDLNLTEALLLLADDFEKEARRLENKMREQNGADGTL
jgi:hypothetical protein